MAHADYDCCAVCDIKLSYAGAYGAETKEEFCGECYTQLKKLGIPIRDYTDIGSFIGWVEKTDVETVKEILVKLDFYFCYYDNDVDEIVARKLGLERIPYGKSLKEVLNSYERNNMS